MNEKLCGFIRKNLYALKRQYGVKVTVYKLLDVDTDYRTGNKTVSRDLHRVRRAVMLPEEILRRAGSKSDKSPAGAGYERGDAAFIFDPRDLPDGFQFDLNDFVVVGDGFYKVIQKEEYGSNLAWVIQTRRVNGANLGITLDVAADNMVTLSQTAGET